MEAFSRLADMSERELMAWHFVFNRLAAFYSRLAALSHDTTALQPDPELVAAQEAVKAELDRRTAEKGTS